MDFRFDDKGSDAITSLKYKLGLESHEKVVMHALAVLVLLTEHGYNTNCSFHISKTGNIVITDTFVRNR